VTVSAERNGIFLKQPCFASFAASRDTLP
jgi:hypothetical protein